VSRTRRVKLGIEGLDTLINELDGVRDKLPSAFGEYGVDDEDDSYTIIEPGKIDSEEVEVALSAVVSTLSGKYDLEDEPESLSDLFEILFSPEDDLVGIALNLEDAINGYFGELFGEDLDLADDYLCDLIAILKAKKEKWLQRNSSRKS
jgi:hypothetical protein